MIDLKQREEDELRDAAYRFREVVDRLGVRSFLFVMKPSDTSVERFYDSNLLPGDPAFHYLNQAVMTDMTLKQELDRWKHYVTGTQQSFWVICANNLEQELSLKLGCRYRVASVFRAVDGYCFVLVDDDNRLVAPPPNHSGFHSSRFQPDLIQTGMN